MIVTVELQSGALKIQNELIKKGFIVANPSYNAVLRLDPALTLHKTDLKIIIQNKTPEYRIQL